MFSFIYFRACIFRGICLEVDRQVFFSLILPSTITIKHLNYDV